MSTVGFMARKIKVIPRKADVLDEGRQTPVLDLSDVAVKELVRTANKRGYIGYDQIVALLASDEVSSEQIESILAKFSEMGINVVETKDARLDEEVVAADEADEEMEGGNELVEIQHDKAPAKSSAKEPAERTNDPVRLYLREMGSMELLSREGEITIARRIEAGREAMMAALCESPLTFQAIIIWRDDLNDGRFCYATSSTSMQPWPAPMPNPRRRPGSNTTTRT
jgi:RNA polymerase primary sigma factor